MKLKSKTEALKIDANIDASGTLTIPENAYVVLTNKDEIPLGISKAGEYKVADIDNLYKNVDESSLTEEFFEYIAGNMVRSDDVERRSGGVYRAVGDLMINPFDSATVIGKQLTFEWNNPNNKTMYLKIFDAESWDILCDVESTDSVYTIDADEEGLIDGKSYAWVMAPVEGMPQSGTELLVFKMADKSYIKSFNKQLKDVERDARNAQMRKILKIRIYIENNVYPIPPYNEL
jgi:hypothetical protein